MAPRPKAIFFGSPDFAVPCLDATAEVCDVVLVLCQPDRPAGRGLSLRKPAVKVRAEELGLPVEQPTKVRTRELGARLRHLNADIGVVVAYGRILPRAVLDAPRLGCVNVHASLLPRWRGAAPIQWAIVSGDHETGVTLMQMDEGMDTGPVLTAEPVSIDPAERASELFERLSALGADLLRRELPRILAGELEPRAQDSAHATHAAMLKKEDGRISWDRPAQAIHDQIRGLYPWPGAYTFLGGKRVRVHRARVSLDGDAAAGSRADSVASDPGAILLVDRRVEVVCAEGSRLQLLELQEDGRKRLDAAPFMAGKRLESGAAFDLEPGDRA